MTDSAEEKYVKQLKELPPDTQSLVAEIVEVNSHTQQILEKLEHDAIETEKIVQQKREALDILQKQNETFDNNSFVFKIDEYVFGCGKSSSSSTL